ncbi:integrase catalytic subunit [Serratia sp. SCBI]|nr:integrase catalytic subunit [Serratia sp. SCBI]AIM20112.1 integrase catalytic subunit [Serratia sp. SCBI]
MLTELAERYPRYGFKKLFQLLRRQGNNWNHKRVHRIYCLLKLNFRRKGKQRLPARNPTPLATRKRLTRAGPSILCMMRWSAADASGPSMWLMTLTARPSQ